MDKEEIIRKMKEGWALRNRGSAWYLIAPLVPHEAKNAELIEEKIVNELKEKGLIDISIPYKTIVAELADIT